jgi:hypothetical protein
MSWWGSLEETDRVKEQFVSGKIILKLILRNRMGGVGVIRMAQN